MSKDLDQLYRSLLLALGQECEHYQELLQTVTAEEAILIGGGLDEIVDFNAKNERLLLSLKMAAEMRVNATRQLAEALHLDESVTMTRLVAGAEGVTRKNLIACREKFAELLAAIKMGNDRNRDLIAVSLLHVNNTMNFINNLNSSSANYNRQGQRGAGNLQGRLISKAG